MATRETPYSAYNFLVELGDDPPSNTALGGFSDVSGLSTEITMMEYRQGNDKENCVRKIPGMHKSGDITLKRGLMGLKNFWTWVEATRSNPDFDRCTLNINRESIDVVQIDCTRCVDHDNAVRRQIYASH